MTAKEMFEALGYTKTSINGALVYKQQYEDRTKHITFWPLHKGYTVSIDTPHLCSFGKSAITVKNEHLAIHKQMQELGWIE